MDVGIVLPVEGEQAHRENILAVARSAEGLGYHSVWVTDRLLKPLSHPGGYPYSQDRGQIAFRPDRNWLDPVAVMGLVAGITSRVQIGTSVLVLPYRNPIVLAQEAASLDALTGGRILLGVGIGWMAEEFAAVGVAVQERARRSDEYIALMRKLWAHPGGTSFCGQYLGFTDMVLAARTARPGGPPILIGGNSAAAFARVARAGDGWAGVDLTPHDAAHVVSQLRALYAEQGRDYRDQIISVRLRLPAPSDPDRAAGIDAAEMAADLDSYKQAGVTLVIYDVMEWPDQLAAVEWIGAEVLSRQPS